MSWTYVLIAGIFEIGWAIGLKYSNGFKELVPTIATIISFILSFYFLMMATKDLPIGTAYAVWTGIGSVGVVILGIVLFGESKDVLRLACIGLVVAGILGLKLTGGDA
ncbi:MAG: quaternary ammonium compound efflux SMR transporter SugE [Methanomassiliicoccus sp.]|nr:quaternary ammonium compound efflux SMR transporter SugE [Methanomassiliicoccus sp.]